MGAPDPIVRPLRPSSSPAPLSSEDAAVIRAVKGKGIVATITPHFAVAVIAAVTSAWFARKPDPVTADVGSEAHRCNEAVTALRADFTQFKAEQALHNLANESKLNELLARTWNGGSIQPSIQPSRIAPEVSRALSR